MSQSEKTGWPAVAVVAGGCQPEWQALALEKTFGDFDSGKLFKVANWLGLDATLSSGEFCGQIFRL